MTTILNNYPLQKIPLSSFDRLQQTYIIGANGVGKSTTLLKLILRDIHNGYGVCVLDPHGDLIHDVISCMQSRGEDVVLLSLTNPDLPFGLNVFHCDNPHDPIAVQNTVSTILNIFEKVYGVDRTTMARIINYLQALVYLFIHNPDITVLDIPKILDPSKENELLRLRLVQHLPPSPAYDYTRYFWTTYYNQRGYFGRDEELAGVFNKFREMTSVLLYPMFCQKNAIDFSDMMVKRKIVLCKLAANQQDMTSLVGSILIAQILHAGYIRKHTHPFFVYCDEFQNFATADFARLYSEARKFKIGMTISHQTLSQTPEQITDVVLQNAGTLIVFRIGNKDAKVIAGNFSMEPDPAWEEELEPESVQVIKPIEHRRVEEDIIDGEKPVRIPKFNVIDHLLNVGHPNPVVAEFVMQYLQFFKEQQNARVDPASPWFTIVHSLRNEIGVTEDRYLILDGDVEKALRLLNNLFYMSMASDTQKLTIHDVRDVLEACANICGYPSALHSTKLLEAPEVEETEITPQEEREEHRYQKFLNVLWGTVRALRITPIEVDSGQWEPRIRKQINYLPDPQLTLQRARRAILHPQREYSVVADELINGLSALPNYMACVKTRSGEYLIQTTPPPKGVSEAVFQARVRAIWEHNLQDGYVRKREDVEKEILERKPLLSGLSYHLIQPHHSSLASPMTVPPPLPPSRKKTRQRKHSKDE